MRKRVYAWLSLFMIVATLMCFVGCGDTISNAMCTQEELGLPAYMTSEDIIASAKADTLYNFGTGYVKFMGASWTHNPYGADMIIDQNFDEDGLGYMDEYVFVPDYELIVKIRATVVEVMDHGAIGKDYEFTLEGWSCTDMTHTNNGKIRGIVKDICEKGQVEV